MSRLGHGIYCILLSLWAGGITIFTFVITPVVFRGFGRDTASAIVDKLFQVYFPYNLVLSVAALVSFFVYTNFQMDTARRISLYLIIAAVVINLFLNFKVYPDVKRTKASIASFEQTDPDSVHRKEFRKLHGISAVLNLLVLMDGIALIVIDSVTRK